MNQHHLDLILAECRLIVEMGEKATCGPWETLACHIWSPDAASNIASASETNGRKDVGYEEPRFTGNLRQAHKNAAFIARSRSFSPAAAKALIATIEALRDMAGDGTQDSELCDNDGQGCPCVNRAESALKSICDQFAYLLENAPASTEPRSTTAD